MADTIIYIKDENQKKELMQKYPNVKAEWIPVTVAKYGDILPVVCGKDKNGEDFCESGEQFIEEMSKLSTTTD